MNTIYRANYKKSLTVKELKDLLNKLPQEYEDAVVIIQSSLLERNVPLEVEEIRLTDKSYFFDPMDDHKLTDDEFSKLENTKILFIDGDKFTFDYSPNKE